MMKLYKYIFPALALFLFVSPLCAQETTEYGDAYYQAMVILKNTDFTDEFEMYRAMSVCSTLTATEKYSLYNKLAIDEDQKLIGFAGNLLLGLGIGSYIIGDNKGGTTQLLGTLLSGIAFGVGLAAAYDYPEAGSIGIAAGAVGLSIFTVYGYIRPFKYVKLQNQNLESILGFAPMSFSLQTAQPGLMVSIRF